MSGILGEKKITQRKQRNEIIKELLRKTPRTQGYKYPDGKKIPPSYQHS